MTDASLAENTRKTKLLTCSIRAAATCSALYRGLEGSLGGCPGRAVQIPENQLSIQVPPAHPG